MTAGLVRPGSLVDHEARRDVRLLVAGLGEAWDGDDAERWVGHLAPDATWTHLEALPVGGTEALRARFRRARADEPWSLHWLTNESVRIDGDRAHGTWLWLALSSIGGGARDAWSSGDLAVRAERTVSGWRATDLEISTRFRSPVAEGWLSSPLVPVDGSGRSPAGPAPAGRGAAAGVPDPFATPAPRPGADPADPEERAARLVAEPAVRRLLAVHQRGLDAGWDGARLVADWADDAEWVTDGPEGTALHHGRAAVATALDEDAASLVARGRFLADQAVVVAGDRATARATDLWCAVVAGRSRWLAHRHQLEARRDGGTWRVARLARTRILDRPALDGDRPLPVVPGSGVSAP